MSGRGARNRRRTRRKLAQMSRSYFCAGRWWDLFRHIVFHRLARLSYRLFGRNIFKRYFDSDPK